jgi:hypothetical protein
VILDGELDPAGAARPHQRERQRLAVRRRLSSHSAIDAAE